ncbi:MAG: hypothetical protein Q8M23_03255, partial [Bacteroidales bacterium]|nr:hypothetical protein [Bacteroidales bacterium]
MFCHYNEAEIFENDPALIFFSTFAIRMFRKKLYTSSSSPNVAALRRLLRSKLTLAAIFVIALAMMVAILGYLISPDNSPFANEQYIEISAQKPGFKAYMLKYRKNETVHAQSVMKTMIYGKRSNYKLIPFNAYRFDNDQIVLAEFDPFPSENPREHRYRLADVVFALAPNAPYVIGPDSARFTTLEGTSFTYAIAHLQQVVSKTHFITKRFPLGSDRYGRDVLSQLMIGTRVSLSVGLIAVLISLLAGIFIGALGGYFRG